MEGRVSGLHGGEVGGGVVGDEFQVGGGMGHCLEEPRFVVEADAVFVALARNCGHVVDSDIS